MKITLKNDFHNTTAVVHAEALNHGMHLEIALTPSQMQRTSRKLCGIKDCKCGGPAGIRGYQSAFGKKLIVDQFPRQ